MHLQIALIICFLAAFTDVKIFDIQLVEIFLAISVILVLYMPENKLQISGSRYTLNFLSKFYILLFFLFAGSLLSLRIDFFPPPNIGPLKQPPIATFVRIIEAVLAISSTFLVSLAIKTDPEKFKKVLSAYVTAAVIGSVYGVGSYILWLLDIDAPGVTILDVTRVRGFFVEGGPFGVYLVGAIVLQIIRGHFLKYISQQRFYIEMGILLTAFVLSQSKASFLLLAFMGVVFLIHSRYYRLLVIGALVLLPLSLTTNLIGGLNGYYWNWANYASSAAERPDDSSLVYGRLAGSVLLPRIVAMHPIAGVGLGNYALVRNDPMVLRGLPPAREWDLHGLGLLGYMAELGIPITLYVMWLYAYPLIIAWRSRSWIVLLCSYPLMAALFGVQLTFAYPWIIAGIGLAAVAIDQEHRAHLRSRTSYRSYRARSVRQRSAPQTPN